MSKVTYFQLIIDRSISIQPKMEETITVANAQIDLLRKHALRFPEKELYCSIYAFNQEVSKIAQLSKPGMLRDLSFEALVPDGASALHDAAGIAINDLQQAILASENYRKARVDIVIFSTGYDDASTLYTMEEIAEKIQKLENTGRWSFSFFGTTFDAVDRAQKLNIKAKRSMYIGSSLSLKS